MEEKEPDGMDEETKKYKMLEHHEGWEVEKLQERDHVPLLSKRRFNIYRKFFEFWVRWPQLLQTSLWANLVKLMEALGGFRSTVQTSCGETYLTFVQVLLHYKEALGKVVLFN